MRQVEGCGRDLVDEKDYYRRYKVCHGHAVEPSVVVRGSSQRFCQQCGTFHTITDFDQDKRCALQRWPPHPHPRPALADD